jgi:hypothetical protein
VSAVLARTCTAAIAVTLAGCPAPAHVRYVSAEIYAAERPLENALVGLGCPEPLYGTRTDDLGFGRLPVSADRDLARCTLTVAKPAFVSATVSAPQACPAASTCPPLRVDLSPLPDPDRPPAPGEGAR